MGRARARRPRHQPNRMNKTEARYAEQLESDKQAGLIDSYRFEPLKLRLADRTYYTPDFLVIVSATQHLRFVEVKGRPGSGPGGWEDDARVKIKVAAETYTEFEFFGASWLTPKNGGPGWKEECFSRVLKGSKDE